MASPVIKKYLQQLHSFYVTACLHPRTSGNNQCLTAAVNALPCLAGRDFCLSLQKAKATSLLVILLVVQAETYLFGCLLLWIKALSLWLI